MEGASPRRQEGEVPYAEEGGRLSVPTVVREESLRFVLAIPDEPLPAGRCWPIVEVAHGTGGDAYSFVGDGTAGRLAARGLASISLRCTGRCRGRTRRRAHELQLLNPDAACGASDSRRSTPS
jgi:hypothetical protein